MKMLILTICAGLMAMAPMVINACDKCDAVYEYVMCEQYHLSNDYYETDDPQTIELIEAKLSILYRVRYLVESPI